MSNLIASVFLIISLIIMTALPLLFVHVITKNKGKLDDPEVQDKYGFLFVGLKTDCQWSSFFSMFFIIRRTAVAIVIIELHEYSGLQLIAVVSLSTIMVVYVAHFRPYKEESMNKNELFNEICGFIVIYILKWLAVFPAIDVSEVSVVEKVGWCYIAAVSLNIVVNFVLVGYKTFLNLPSTCRKLKSKYGELKLNLWKRRFHQRKLRYHMKNPNMQIHQFHYEESLKIKVRDEFLKELDSLQK